MHKQDKAVETVGRGLVVGIDRLEDLVAAAVVFKVRSGVVGMANGSGCVVNELKTLLFCPGYDAVIVPFVGWQEVMGVGRPDTKCLHDFIIASEVVCKLFIADEQTIPSFPIAI